MLKACSKCLKEKAVEEFYRGRARCRTCESAAQKAWRQNNPDKFKACVARYRSENAEATRAFAKCRQGKWAKSNPGILAEGRARSRAAVRVATPPWADRAEIRKVYARAAALGMTVDHIHPLRGANVCGLHVPWNLQLLSHSANASKSNKFPWSLDGELTT